MHAATLDAYLNSVTANGDALRAQAAETVRQFASAATQLRKVIMEGPLEAANSGARSTANAAGDLQHELDVSADKLFLEAARSARVAFYASEEQDHPVAVDESGAVSVAVDPLDGSSNIETNVSVGTIFSIVPASGEADDMFLKKGSEQVAAGFFIYGPQLGLVLTFGSGTRAFIFSQRLGSFVQARKSIAIAPNTCEFAVNASNYRHWDEPVRLYVDDCLTGAEGPREKDFNMRWIASLVAEAQRILMRGGVFLYPRDGRKGYGQGRLRLIYEANPIAFVVEQAGGAATNGAERILDIVPTDLHQRTPLVFGSAKEVAKIARYHTDPSSIGVRHPLFGHRGLFRA